MTTPTPASTPSLDQTSVVLLGSFNPAIMQPAWFAMNNILGKNDCESAVVNVIHPEMTSFIAGEYTFMIEPQRFTVSCDYIYCEMVRDLVLSVFGSLLTHTPISALGINRGIHFDTGDFWVRDKVGLALAPTSAWGKWGDEIAGPKDNIEKHGGMFHLAMRQMRQEPDTPGYIQASIQPSNHPSFRNSGIFMFINNHYDLYKNSSVENLKVVADSKPMVETLDKHWKFSVEKTSFIIDQIKELVESCRGTS